MKPGLPLCLWMKRKIDRNFRRRKKKKRVTRICCLLCLYTFLPRSLTSCGFIIISIASVDFRFTIFMSSVLLLLVFVCDTTVSVTVILSIVTIDLAIAIAFAFVMGAPMSSLPLLSL